MAAKIAEEEAKRRKRAEKFGPVAGGVVNAVADAAGAVKHKVEEVASEEPVSVFSGQD